MTVALVVMVLLLSLLIVTEITWTKTGPRVVDPLSRRPPASFNSFAAASTDPLLAAGTRAPSTSVAVASTAASFPSRSEKSSALKNSSSATTATCISPSTLTGPATWPFSSNSNPTNVVASQEQVSTGGSWATITAWWKEERARQTKNNNGKTSDVRWNLCEKSADGEYATVTQTTTSRRDIRHSLHTVPIVPASAETQRLMAQWLADGTLVIDSATLYQHAPALHSSLLPGFLAFPPASSSGGGGGSNNNVVVGISIFVDGGKCIAISALRSDFLVLANVLLAVQIAVFRVGSRSPWQAGSGPFSVAALTAQSNYLHCQPEYRYQRRDKNSTTSLSSTSSSNSTTTTNNTEKTKRIEIAACVITRNRARSLLEFIQYHRIVGVSRFIVFDDSSSDNTVQALQSFIRAGIVVLMQGPLEKVRRVFYSGRQQIFYHRCAQFVANMHRSAAAAASANAALVTADWWAMYVDTDEFVVPPSGQCLQTRVEQWTREFPGSPELAMTLRHVPTRADYIDHSDDAYYDDDDRMRRGRGSGSRADDTVVTAFESSGWSPGRLTFISVKPLFQPAKFVQVQNPHANFYIKGRTRHHAARLSDGTRIAHVQYDIRVDSKAHRDLVVLHYLQGSFSQYFTRKITGRADVTVLRYTLDLARALQQWKSLGKLFATNSSDIVASCDPPPLPPPDGVSTLKDLNEKMSNINSCLRCLLNVNSKQQHVPCEVMCASVTNREIFNP